MERVTMLTGTDQFIELIEAERKRQGISIEELARRAGLTHSAYWYTLRRAKDRRVTLETALRYADALGIDLKTDTTRAGRRQPAEAPSPD